MAHIGILHPGAMGSAVGRCLVDAGHDVAWVSQDRSADSARRAVQAGFRDIGSFSTLREEVDTVVSICPPAAAVDVARAVLQAGFRGRFVDANAVAPATARTIADEVLAAGGIFVDGSIVGGPPRPDNDTRLYLAGDAAAEVAGWFDGTALGTVVLAGPVGAASALKAGFAGYTKGSAALELAVRAYARAHGIEDALMQEWATSLPEVHARADGLAGRIHRKAWRFEGELREIGDALAEVGLPGGFHHAAADIYARLADLKDVADEQDPAEVLDRVLSAGRADGQAR